MKLTIIDIAHHRNGVSSEPFDIVLFNDRSENKGRRMVGILFEARGHCAVMDVVKLAEGDIAFGSNSWRGDNYDPYLRAAIEEHEAKGV